MSGILKRKLEEGPSYLSLQGSDDDEVSCSDSGNSSDSLNHSVPSGILDCKVPLFNPENTTLSDWHQIKYWHYNIYFFYWPQNTLHLITSNFTPAACNSSYWWSTSMLISPLTGSKQENKLKHDSHLGLFLQIIYFGTFLLIALKTINTASQSKLYLCWLHTFVQSPIDKTNVTIFL